MKELTDKVAKEHQVLTQAQGAREERVKGYNLKLMRDIQALRSEMDERVATEDEEFKLAEVQLTKNYNKAQEEARCQEAKFSRARDAQLRRFRQGRVRRDG